MSANEIEDSFQYTKNKRAITNESIITRQFHDNKLHSLPVELPPPIDEITDDAYAKEESEDQYNEEKTFWDGKIEETFEFPGQTPGWKFETFFYHRSILYHIDPRETDDWDLKNILNYLAMQKGEKPYMHLLHDEDLLSSTSPEDTSIWATKAPQKAQDLLLQVIPLAGDHVYNKQNLEYA
ncbi:hypothetical protein K3495_g4939 [Podosphaera aphanis]|nr:hypothetical protein K3495_g4939 [Podosphaera aphanis]